MKKYYIWLAAAIVLIAAGIGAFFIHSAPEASQDKVTAVASFYPLYFLAHEIGGTFVDVQNVTPAGAEPHEYEPTPQDMVAIANANVVILNGAHLEAWGPNVLTTVDPNRTQVVMAGDTLATQTVDEDGEMIQDPHVWLAPSLAKQMATRIADAFVKADPAHETEYRANLQALEQELDALDQEYRAGLASCARKDIITSHAAFGYLATAYGLHQVPISGLSPDEEPSVKQLADVASFAKANRVRYIFFESLVSPKLSQTVATEIGAQTLVLSPLEGLTEEEMSAGQDYFTVMRSNLSNLRLALQCQ